jgi:hypothetical protein
LELGARSQEPGEKRKKEEGRSQKKCFYKYEMLPPRLPVCADGAPYRDRINRFSTIKKG